VSGGDDHAINRWSLSRSHHTHVLTMNGHSSRVTAITCDSQRYNRVISADAFGCIGIWNMDPDAIVDTSPSSAVPSSSLPKAQARSPRLLSWVDQAHSLEVKSLSASWHTGTATSVRVATASGDCNIKIWDTANTHNMLAICHGHTAAINCVQMIDDHILLSGSRDLSIRLWDIRIAPTGRGTHGHNTTDNDGDTSDKNDRCLMTLEDAHDMFVTSVQADDRIIKVWDIRTHKCISTLFDMNDFVTHIHLISPGIVLFCLLVPLLLVCTLLIFYYLL
jgi:WD40 repeat protein